MSYIPDCRSDEYYNQKYLSHDNAICLIERDLTASDAGGFFDNLDIYPELNNLLADDQWRIVKDCLMDYLEMQRDNVVTSMIDSMDESEYEQNKANVDSDKMKNEFMAWFENQDIQTLLKSTGVIPCEE